MINNKRIIITAPRNYAHRLSAEIINFGGLPILMPTIETCFLEEYTELDAALRNIDKFDWIAFTSRKGIDAFWQRIQVLDLSISILNNCHFCAIGKDSERLSELGINVDLIPRESSPEGIVAALSELPDIQNQTVLVPVPKVVGFPEPNIVPNFLSGLEKLGMKVTGIPVYVTRCLDKKIYDVELELIRRGKIDAHREADLFEIAFSSTGEVECFLKMVNSQQDYNHIVVACFGPYTAANAKKLGLNVAIVAENYSSFKGFVEAISKRYASRCACFFNRR